MSSRSIYERFKDSNKDNNVLECTKQDLEEYIMYGLVLKTGKKYVNRNNQELKLDLIKTIEIDFDLNLSNILKSSQELAKENKVTRIYCMTDKCYKHYKDVGLIIQVQGKDYFRLFDKELWLVNLINN